MATPAANALPRRSFAIIFAVSAATAMGNTGLISVLPAIGRSTGIPDAMVSAIFSLSALLWAFSSPAWARASDRHGRKPLMLVGLLGFMVSMALCGLVVSAGLRQLAPPMIIFILFLLARALFGLFGAASNPATQAYVAERTPIEGRTQAMASLAGAFGLGTVIGPFLAPLFILPVVGLAGPLFSFALIALVMLFIVWRYLPDQKVSPENQRPRRPVVGGAAKALPMWRDPRITPFLIYGFIVATCQTAQAQTLGFLIIDKLGMSPAQAQYFIAIAMMFGAVAGLLAQWGLIRMFEMTPRQLLRWGVAIAALGNLIVALSNGYYGVVAGYAISSLGFGFARPGFTAGSSIAVDFDEQARVAGAIAAVNGINVVLAPAFVFLYQHFGPAPFILNTALMAGMLVYAFRNTALKNADPKPASREATALATLEKSDEGGAT
ncbi:MAG: MFS transporter [Phenylobacterium sp.]|jgi:MFS family permease|uniref:MFS transporter n=1 Tax=unclassified Phenylobacterium TaxID=2640670 RepID=UPI0008C1144C|nr:MULTISPECIES: MFS transporter [unclassified Phenylobacterium]MBJ7412182.1 MFS transporter [Phenylobacterium sp.]OHB27426.1 MAG: MFS transporter [Phenylobacterium sp. RIFCSPHIGHO2_01_FULL_69_31]